MENQTVNQIGWKTGLQVLAAILVYAGVVFFAFTIHKDLREANNKIQNEKELNSTCSYKRDSLIKEVKQLSIYKSLTKAMVHRDEATSMLKYKVGDFVYLKRDSAKVVVDDIIVGGAKYEYYIKYRVLHKDNHTEEVKPELVY